MIEQNKEQFACFMAEEEEEDFETSDASMHASRCAPACVHVTPNIFHTATNFNDGDRVFWVAEGGGGGRTGGGDEKGPDTLTKGTVRRCEGIPNGAGSWSSSQRA